MTVRQLRHSRLLLICSVCLLAACGGSTGDSKVSGTAVAPAQGPGDTLAYFPTTPGNAWYFDQSTTSSADAVAPTLTQTVTIGSPTIVHGQSATTFQTVSDDPSVATRFDYFVVNGGGLTDFGNSDGSDTLSPLITPEVLLTFPVNTPTQASNLSGNQVAYTPAGSSTEPVNLAVSNSVPDIESVTVAAGTFAGALRLVQQSTISGPVSSQSTLTRWLAPGVGVVRETTSTTSAAGVTATVDRQLRGYMAGGTQHGIGNPVTLATGNPFPASSDPLQQPSFSDAQPVSASDGSHAVVLYPNTANGSVQGYTITISNAQGAAVSGPPFSIPSIAGSFLGPAAIAYSGDHFVVVYPQNTAPGESCNSARQFFAVSMYLNGGSSTLTNAIALADLPGCRAVIASNGSLTLVGIPNSSGILFTPIITNGSGAALDSVNQQQFPVDLSATLPSDSGSLTFDGTNFVYVGQDSTGVFAVRLDATGTLLDSGAGIRVQNIATIGGSIPAAHPRVANDGTNDLVVWQDHRATTVLPAGQTVLPGEIYLARFTQQGALLDGVAASDGIAISAGAVAASKSGPAVAWVNGEYLVAWTSGTQPVTSASTIDGPFTVVATRVSSSGQLLGPGGPGIPISPTPASTVNSAALSSPASSWGAMAAGVVPLSGSALITWGSMPSGIATAASYSLQAVSVFPFAQ